MSHGGYFSQPHLPFPPPPFPPPFGNPGLSNPRFSTWRPNCPVSTQPVTGHHRPPLPPTLRPPPLLRPHDIRPPHMGDQPQSWTNVHVVTPEIFNSVKSQEDFDREWIEKFSHNCDCNRPTVEMGLETKEQKTITISKAKKLHLRAYSLVERLHMMEFKSSAGVVMERNKLKGDLDNILSTLNDKVVLACLSAKVKKSMKKRKKMKQKRGEKFLLRKEQRKRIKQKQDDADDWLRRCYLEQENQKREQQVQKDLDDYLNEVRQKQTDLRKSLDMLNALGKLRKARKESAIRKGMTPSIEMDKNFQCVQTRSREHLLACMSACEEEEKKLRSFLAKESRLELDKMRKKEKEAKRNEWIKDREVVLFGSQVTFDVADPMWPIQQVHKRASESLIVLAQTRRQWDCFISDSGTRIPLCWVQPDEPSSEKWRTHLEEASLEK